MTTSRCFAASKMLVCLTVPPLWSAPLKLVHFHYVEGLILLLFFLWLISQTPGLDRLLVSLFVFLIKPRNSTTRLSA